jgi:uncharacterized protein (TIGR02996 family)
MGQEGREEVAPRGDGDQHAAFLAAIRAEPREPLHRLAYADWLEERGDPRADYFRIEAALAAQDATGHDPALWEQWVDLRCTFEPEWMDAIPRLFRPTCRELVEEFWAFATEGHISFRLRNGEYLEGYILEVKDITITFESGGPLAGGPFDIPVEQIDLNSLSYAKQVATVCVGVSATWSEEEARWVHRVEPPHASLESPWSAVKRPWWKFW